MRISCFIRGVILFLTLSLASVVASAHNVLGTVYAIGTDIEGAIGFSNGELAPEGSVVTISDPSGNTLAEVSTDADGIFVYSATDPVDHHIFADLGAGHIYQAVLPAADLGFQYRQPTPSSTVTGSISADPQIELLIEQAVARQVQPLVKELNLYKEKASLQDILGAIGYIFGICGLLMIMKVRKAEQSKSN